MTDTAQPMCGATDTIRIESQIEQTARCQKSVPHKEHCAIILDSDDNAITHRWRDR